MKNFADHAICKKREVMMNRARRTMTPLEIFNAIESLTDAEKETLSMLADEKLSEELMKRRRDALIEMKKGELINEEELLISFPSSGLGMW